MDFQYSRQKYGKFMFADKTFANTAKIDVERAFLSWVVILSKKKRNFILHLIKENIKELKT